MGVSLGRFTLGGVVVVGEAGVSEVEEAESFEVEALDGEAGEGGRCGLVVEEVGVVEASVAVCVLVGEVASRSLLTVS